ncbi:hypothetical protein D3C84_603110 [compost metagenome]
MTVGELIEALKAFEPGSKVLIQRSDSSGLEDVVACYEELVCAGRVFGYERIDEASEASGLDMTTAEKVVVIDMDFQL